MTSENLRFILGLKIKTQRTERHLSLRDVAEKTGLSISYLSEIEKGKKYPKPEKLLLLSQVLDLSFDNLVSTQLTDQLDPLKTLLGSEMMRSFPFEIFGITGQDLLELVAGEPHSASALIQTLSEIVGEYDMHIDHFLHAALRSFQAMKRNYFPELEEAAVQFRKTYQWSIQNDPSGDALVHLAQKHFGQHVFFDGLPDALGMPEIRSVRIEGAPERLYINPKLWASQRIFILLRELGFKILTLPDAPVVSGSQLGPPKTFEGLLSYFKASYFAGAVMLDGDTIVDELQKLFSKTHWDVQHFSQIKARYAVTPELFLYRLSQLVPGKLGLRHLYYQRFTHPIGSDDFLLTKRLNLSPVFMYHGKGLNEHYCRRWTALAQLRALSQFPPSSPHQEAVSLKRLEFMDAQANFLSLSISRRLLLKERHLSAITIGLMMDEQLKSVVKFWNDPSIAVVQVNETCERCSLSPLSCTDRVAPARIYDQHIQEQKQQEIFQNWIQNIKQS
ncbi:MAG: helix-turn-helix domain-containing protein [Bacteroidetes Order II. Incertae sedis bacterium]|nr:helix-turn-helix domain-containing protein [Bacteroidetes Order II. bacterium]